MFVELIEMKHFVVVRLIELVQLCTDQVNLVNIINIFNKVFKKRIVIFFFFVINSNCIGFDLNF
jgi:hypothetical protein